MQPLTLAEAIAREEGYFVDGSRAQRNNNPGNIEYGVFSKAYGALSGDPRFAIFYTSDAGWNCLKALLKYHYVNLSYSAIINKWAPSIENDTSSYIRNICAWMEVQPEDIFTGD